MNCNISLIPRLQVSRVAVFAGVLLQLSPVVFAGTAETGGGVSAGAIEFEEPPVLHAPDLLPDYLLAGEVFTVEVEVRNDGEANHYVVRSPLGDLDARGRHELERAIQELRALALLQDTQKRTGAIVGFNQGMKKFASAPYNKVKRMVFNPLYAIEAVPREIISYAGKVATVSDVVKYGPRVFIRRSLGIDSAREALARRLGVDEETDHAALREEINRVGWGVWMGGLAPTIAEGSLDLDYDLAIQVGDQGHGNLGRAVNVVRREVFPPTARRMLRKMDVPKPTIKAFRSHPHFSGRMREHIAYALRAMEETENREAFIVWANSMDSKVEARQAVRLAQVMAIHHATKEEVELILSDGTILMFETSDEAVVPLLYDYLIWSPTAADRLARAEALKAEHAPDSAMAVWMMGDVSPRLREVLDDQDIAVRTEVDRDYGKFDRPRKGLKKLEQQYERRVEDPIKEKVRKRLSSGEPKRLTLEPLGGAVPR